MLGVGAATKTYIEDLFSTYVYTGTGSSQTISTGIDQSGKGALTWIKERSGTQDNILVDSVRGPTKRLVSNGSGQETTDNSVVSAFTSSGFTVGDSAKTNDNGETFSSWTFRKAKGFFDVVQYTGDGNASKVISHNLGCQPGLLMVKRTDATDNWNVYHRDTGTKALFLNGTSAGEDHPKFWNDTAPTSTQFTVGTDDGVNADGGEYIAYLFAGGESSAATARSVEFDGTGDELIPNATLIPVGNNSNKFCLETWFRLDDDEDNQVIYSQYEPSSSGRMMLLYEGDKVYLWMGGNELALNTGANSIFKNQWYHIAWTYDGTTHRMFLNGTLTDTLAGSSLPAAIYQGNERIAKGYGLDSYILDGKLSNFRIVQDQAVYTTSFKPSTIPLTTTSQGVTGSNCKLLCCNDSSITGTSTGTVTSGGDPVARTDSPFDDPAGFTFGENKDQQAIKCGRYKGTGSSSAAPNIFCGFEPQWVLIKRVSDTEDWMIWDTMRGLSVATTDPYLRPNLNNGEALMDDISITSTGFEIISTNNEVNGVNDDYIYMAVRRPDGYIGKPAEAGTDVFAMDTGNATASTNPAFDSGFPVDFGFLRAPASSSQWLGGARLTQGKYQRIEGNDAEANASHFSNDSNEGWKNWSNGTGEQAWMWKRHAGFDVVTYKGNGTAGKQVRHSLGKVPQMMWIKRRDSADNWAVYHFKANGGTNPSHYFLKINSTDEETDNANFWNDTDPTSDAFSLGPTTEVNGETGTYLAMLFSSVDGISKVGSWTGTGDTQTITVGFAPRFLMWKRANASEKWYVVDTLRGWTSSASEPYLQLNSSNAQSNTNLGDISSTGFTVTSGDNWQNNSGDNYIYYCHA